jgi:seryl-tRNA synthetase
MISLKNIRENPEQIKAALSKRLDHVDLSVLLDYDKEYRSLTDETSRLRGQRNLKSKNIGQLKRKNEDTLDLESEVKAINASIDANLSQENTLKAQIQLILDSLPNIPDDIVPPGGKESNQKLHEYGEKPFFDFTPKTHIELIESLGLVDFKRGAKISGSGFWIYRRDGALLEWALLNFFIQEHLKDGYEFLIPPHMLLKDSGYVAGQFPKFADDVFYISNMGDGESHFWLPTAETAIINMHKNEILDADKLPLKYFAYTPCYRREAGGYRTEERGTIRGHQFNKTELFQFVQPDKSDQAFDELLAKAESLVQKLGLHYQISLLGAKDTSYAMAKTVDIEVWIPSLGQYKEVSSVSNARDFQAIRGNMRFKHKDEKNTSFINTLNASGLATSRLMPAILEQFQLIDGSVLIPEVLINVMGKDKLKPI